MPYRLEFVDPVLALLWTETPTLADYDKIGPEIEAIRARKGKRLPFLIIVPTSMSPPAADVRKRGVADTRAMLNGPCSTMHAVVVGSGIALNMFRALLRGMLMLLADTRKRTFIHATIAEALDRIAEDNAIDRKALEALCRGWGCDV